MSNTVSRTVDDDTLNRIIQIESSGNPNARATTSSALGLGQFLNATWLGTVKAHSPQTFKGRTQAQVLALRTDPSFSIEMLARFEEDNLRIVGAGASPGDIYLAHFLGAGDAQKFYRASPKTPAAMLVNQKVVAANRSILQGKSAGQVRAWAAKRMAESGGHDWIAKYYRPRNAPVPLMASQVLPETFSPNGDAELLTAQTQLKAMRYYTGELDGLWGSKSAGAISGFINDRGGFMAAPTSLAQYKSGGEQIVAELDRAEAEHFTRPVTESRAIADPKAVARIAPEVVPARKSMWATASGFVVTFIAAVWDTVSDWASALWNFFTANKDNIPVSATDPSFVSSMFHKVPPSVWLFAVAALLAFIGANAYLSVRKINNAVSTGER